MAKQTINLGTGELTGDGESIRSAFSKVNENFNEVYTDIPVDISELTDTQGLLNSGSANIGDVTFNGVQIIGAGTASGDGFGYSTLELVPDNNLYANNQYLVIDPTAPSHIHIRAGGPIDNSNADLFLGGEKTHVRVRDNQGVRMQNEALQTIGFYNFNNPNGFTLAAWQSDGFGGYQIIINDPTPEVFTAVWDLAASSFIQIFDGTNYISLTANGNTSTPGGGPITFGVVEAPLNDPTSIVNLEIQNSAIRTNYAELNGTDFTVNVYDDLRLTGSDVVSIRNRSATGPITIITDWDNIERTWSFGANGDLNLPQDGGLVFDRNNTSIRVGMGFHIASGEGISIDAIDQTDPNNLITKGWYFSPTGNLTLPGNIDSIDSIALQAGDAVNITSNNTVSAKTWTFDEVGALTFPDATVQTTAWAGGRVVNAPVSSIGAIGDKQGDLAFNGSYMYYCTQDFAESSYSTTIVSSYTGFYPSIVKGTIPQPQTGWAFIHNGTSYTLASNAVENNPGEWTCELTTSISVTAGDTVTLGPVFSSDIWKRVAWSTDTW